MPEVIQVETAYPLGILMLEQDDMFNSFNDFRLQSTSTSSLNLLSDSMSLLRLVKLVILKLEINPILKN